MGPSGIGIRCSAVCGSTLSTNDANSSLCIAALSTLSAGAGQPLSLEAGAPPGRGALTTREAGLARLPEPIIVKTTLITKTTAPATKSVPQTSLGTEATMPTTTIAPTRIMLEPAFFLAMISRVSSVSGAGGSNSESAGRNRLLIRTVKSIGISLTETSETTFNLSHPSSSRFTQLSTAQKITHNMCTESQSIQTLLSRETPHF